MYQKALQCTQDSIEQLLAGHDWLVQLLTKVFCVKTYDCYLLAITTITTYLPIHASMNAYSKVAKLVVSIYVPRKVRALVFRLIQNYLVANYFTLLEYNCLFKDLFLLTSAPSSSSSFINCITVSLYMF